jgi:hypothetical protein
MQEKLENLSSAHQMVNRPYSSDSNLTPVKKFTLCDFNFNLKSCF